MNSYTQLRQFTSAELLFNDEETRMVLKFIFNPVDHALIDSLPMSDSLKGFAQGLLVEAIDASYAVGYVAKIFESTANPVKGVVNILKSFGKKAAKHWFKHASVHDLQSVKIYDFVRDEIVRRFRHPLQINFLASNKVNGQSGAFIAYTVPAHGIIKSWG